MAASKDGTVYVGDELGVIRQFSPDHTYERVTAGRGGVGFGNSGDGGPATGARLSSVEGMAVDRAGNLVFTGSNRIRVVAKTSGRFYGKAMTAADVYTIAGNGQGGFSGDGGKATSAKLGFVFAVAIDGAGNVLINDGNNRLRAVAVHSGTFYGKAMTAGDIYTIVGNGTEGSAGDGGPATAAQVGRPFGMTTDSHGNILIADTDNNRLWVVAARSGIFYSKAMVKGDIYTIAGTGTRGFAGDGGPATAAELSGPTGVELDKPGNLVISDTQNQRVRVVAGSNGRFYGRAMVKGHIYTVAGNGVGGHSGNGGPATSATLALTGSVAFDKPGNMLIPGGFNVRAVAGSTGTFYHQAMVKGDIYTIAGNGFSGTSGNGGKASNAELMQPDGLTVTHAGTYLFAERAQVRMVPAVTGTYFGTKMVAGNIYAVAGNNHLGRGPVGIGGPATSAKLSNPRQLALDSAGNLVFTDLSDRVLVVAARQGTFYGQAMTRGHIYSVAGTGAPGSSGDGGPATAATLSAPTSLAIDGAGNLIAGEANGDRLRVVAARSGTFYGRAMTAGDIYTIAGTGQANESGDGGPATKAQLSQPAGLGFDGAGDLFVSDLDFGRIREISG